MCMVSCYGAGGTVLAQTRRLGDQGQILPLPCQCLGRSANVWFTKGHACGQSLYSVTKFDAPHKMRSEVIRKQMKSNRERSREKE